jgi:deoxyribodipyrimidine photo-lyase
MTSARRLQSNFALDRAIDWAETLNKPLLIVEALGCGSHWASKRHHRFILDGMADNQRRLAGKPATYFPYIEHRPGEGRKFFRAVAKLACLVVTDDFPLPADLDPEPWTDSKARIEKIDGNGLLPLAVATEAFKTAHGFRRFLQSRLREHLLDIPRANPFSRRKIPPLRRIPAEISAFQAFVDGMAEIPSGLKFKRDITPVDYRGGSRAARVVLEKFLRDRLSRYAEKRGDVSEDASSGLSPYLHYGHLSSFEIFHALADRESWTPDRLAEKVSGRAVGWWGMSESSECFLDELVTWREVGYNFCRHRDDCARYDSLPDWARATLKKHAKDKRDHVYSLAEFDASATHDPLWNAAQRQLVREGRIQNYLRMLWGKKILEWSATPEEAAETMIELNNRYAMDGDDPNSYSGIFWVLGRYDRPWGPERPIFGTVRYMSSENTARKMRVAGYLEKFAE